MAKARKSLFDDYYGNRHFQLQVLATSPKFQRIGAGSMLCKWGIELAERTGMSISVFASPMGRKVYAKLGFCRVRDVIVQAETEDQRIVLTAMAYEPVLEQTAWAHKSGRGRGKHVSCRFPV